MGVIMGHMPSTDAYCVLAAFSPDETPPPDVHYTSGAEWNDDVLVRTGKLLSRSLVEGHSVSLPT